MSEPASSYQYVFSFPDREELVFMVPDLSQAETEGDISPPPPWTRLGYHQCRPCPLDEALQPHCPIALRIAALITAFQDTDSFAPCTVRCHSSQRTVSKVTVVQEGLASLLGLTMATSGCPIMDFLKPLARFHLPFASVEETIFRTAAVCLLRQYFEQADENRIFSINAIKTSYARVMEVNTCILNRIRHLATGDADRNSLVTLTGLVQILELELTANFESLQQLFGKTS